MINRTHDPASLDRASTIIGALDSPLRIQILLKLRERPHVVHELVTSLGKSQPLISQHLRVLKKAGIVDSHRSGREVSYELVMPGAADIIDDAADLGGETGTTYPPLTAVPDEGRVDGGTAAIVGPTTSAATDMPGLLPNTAQPPAPTQK